MVLNCVTAVINNCIRKLLDFHLFSKQDKVKVMTTMNIKFCLVLGMISLLLFQDASSFHSARYYSFSTLERYNDRGSEALMKLSESKGSSMEQEIDKIDPHKQRENNQNVRLTVQSRIVATGDGKLPDINDILMTDQDYKTYEALEAIFHVESWIRLKHLLQNKPVSPDELQNRDDQKQQLQYIYDAIQNAGFELLSQRDLDLCEALNSDYLLRLSLVPNLSGLDPELSSDLVAHHKGAQQYHNGTKSMNSKDNDFLFDGKVIIFRRGYSDEITTGTLLLPKIDYFQANLVQRGTRQITDAITSLIQQILTSIYSIATAITNGIRDVLLSSLKIMPSFMSRFGEELMDVFDQTDDDAKASEKLIRLNRYGGGNTMTPDLGDRLIPFLYQGNNDNPNHQDSTGSEDNESYMSREWKSWCSYDEMNELMPKSFKILERINIGNVVKSGARKRELLKKLFSKSKLVEPTYEEVIVLWRPTTPKSPIPTFPQINSIPQIVRDAAEVFDLADKLPPRKRLEVEIPKVPQFEIRIFEKVTMANIYAVMPKRRLVFRPADALRIDFVSGASFLAVFAQLRYDNPRLDLLALVSVSFWILRTFFRYSNILARYELVVKKFLTSKILQKSNGALRYIDNEASNQIALRTTFLLAWIEDELKYREEIDTQFILDYGGDGIQELFDINNIDVDITKTLTDLKDLDLIQVDADDKVSISEDVLARLRSKWIYLFDGVEDTEIDTGSTLSDTLDMTLPKSVALNSSRVLP